MTTLLIVPVHLDALYLAEDRYVTEPTADFTRLPYVDPASKDVNPDLPYLSEIILSKPFQDQRLLLKKGIHLHWALPDALTRAEQSDGQTTFHAVPNRWLITRNCCDPALARYRWVEKCYNPVALGYSGMVGRNLLAPEIDARIEELDVTHLVGGTHDNDAYLYCESIVRRTR